MDKVGKYSGNQGEYGGVPNRLDFGNIGFSSYSWLICGFPYNFIAVQVYKVLVSIFKTNLILK